MINRVLMVNEFFSYGDGSSLYLIDVSNRLKKLGYEISILFGTHREKEVQDSEIKSFYVPGAFGFNYSFNAKVKRKIVNIVSAMDPQIIYIHQVLNPHVVDLLASLRPSIRFEHGFRLSCFTGRRMAKANDRICDYSPGICCYLRAYTQKCSPRNPYLALKRISDFYLNKKAHNKIERIIVASNYIKNLLLKSGYKNKQIKVIPYYTILPGETSQVGPSPTPTIICVSRIEEEKGVNYLLKALSMVHIKTKVFIIGEGSQIEKLKQMIKSLSLTHDVTFTGWLENSELPNYYSQANIAVVPSIWPEPFGIIGIEAMANKLPVVAFDVGGISEWLIDGQTGYLVPPRNVKIMAEKINYIINNKKVSQDMGKEGRKWVERRFNPNYHLNSLLTVFEDVMQAEN